MGSINRLIAPLEKNLVCLTVNRHHKKALVDTGATVSCVSANFLNSIGFKDPLEPAALKQIVGVCGETHAVLGTIELPMCINRLMVFHKFHVFQRLHHDIILGLDFWTKTMLKWIYKLKCFLFRVV